MMLLTFLWKRMNVVAAEVIQTNKQTRTKQASKVTRDDARKHLVALPIA